MDALHDCAAPVTGDAEDLCRFWNDYEATLGIGSSHGVAVNREAGLASGKVEAFRPFDGAACWANADSARARRVRQRLLRVRTSELHVLYAAYGPRNPGARTDLLSQAAARVAAMTALVEEWRRDLARAVAQERFAAALAAERLLATRPKIRGARAPLDDAQLERVRESHARAALRELTPSDALTARLGPRLAEDAPAWERQSRRHATAEAIAELEAGSANALTIAMAAYRAAAGAE